MLYRESGDFKTSYQADQQMFPIRQDRIFVLAVAAIAIFVAPFLIDSYWVKSIIVPFMVYAIAAIGLNILTGYCGQVSLGTGGFMAVGAYCSYKLMTSFPDLNFAIIVLLSGVATAAVGLLFGLPSLRIKGFYLAVATLAAQFFLVWLFNKVPWFYNYSDSGQITAPPRSVLGMVITGPEALPYATYLFCLSFLILLALAAKNVLRGRIGRSWMAIRDMDIAAEIIGVSAMKAKLSAFAVSSFYIGVAGSLYFAIYLGSVEPTEAFGITESFLVLFMIIIGGLGSMLGPFVGAALLLMFPLLVKNIFVDGIGLQVDSALHIETMLLGVFIILFLILEPHGIARLWATVKEKLRLWPFPH